MAVLKKWNFLHVPHAELIFATPLSMWNDFWACIIIVSALLAEASRLLYFYKAVGQLGCLRLQFVCRMEHQRLVWKTCDVTRKGSPTMWLHFRLSNDDGYDAEILTSGILEKFVISTYQSSFPISGFNSKKMDAFESNIITTGEDPAAEFLAREQSELAELGIDDQIGVQQVCVLKKSLGCWSCTVYARGLLKFRPSAS